MAKIVFGPLISDARKKIGGVVFTKARAGAFVRRKVSPIQPRTQAQMNVRANFTYLAKLWSDVTMAPYRAAWTALALSYPKKDKFGATHTLTGLQFFMRLSRALHTIGIDPILPPPTTLQVESLTSLALDATTATVLSITGLVVTGTAAVYSFTGHTGNLPVAGQWLTIAGMTNPLSNGEFQVASTPGTDPGTVTMVKTVQVTDATAGTGTGLGLSVIFTPATLAATSHLIVEATRQMSPGRATSFPSPALITAFGNTTASPQSILADYVAKYGPLISGRKLQISAYVIDETTGAESLKMTAQATAA